MSKVFVSYRRSDTQMAAGRLRESLSNRFGNDAIFRDKDSIAGGEDWTRAIEESLGKDAIVLALIGPNWLSARNEAGARRLDDPADWNRIELEHALSHEGTVVPVLVDNTQMPSAAQLPDSLQALTRVNAVKLRDDDWESDVEQLARVLTRHGLAEKNPTRGLATASSSRRMIMVGIAAAVVAAVGGGLWLHKSSSASVASLSGPWAMTHFNEDSSKHAGTLTLEQSGQTLTGTVAWTPRGASREISGGLVKGSTVEFEVVGPRGAKRVYSGELDGAGNMIQGLAKGGSSAQATWSAVRQKTTARE